MAKGAISPLLLAISLLVTSANAQQSARNNTLFRAQLRDLKKLHYSDTNPSQIIKGYEHLIANSSDHPEVAEAMHHLARYYQSKDLDREKSIHWYRQAIKSSEEVSWVWSKARFELANQLRWKINDEDAVREARSLLEAIAVNFPDQPLTLAEVEMWLVMQCFTEESHIGAEHHCRDLLDWQDHSSDTPLGTLEKKTLQAYQSSAALYLMQRLPNIPGTKRGKTAWLKRFTSDYADRQWLQEAAQPIYHQILDVADPPPALELTSRKDTARTAFLVCNLVVVLVLGVLVFRNRIFNHRQANKAM